MVRRRNGGLLHVRDSGGQALAHAIFVSAAVPAPAMTAAPPAWACARRQRGAAAEALMLTIAAVFSQIEKKRLVRKLKAARDRKRASGVKVEGRKSHAEPPRLVAGEQLSCRFCCDRGHSILE
jgi:hypothetical protein